MYASALNFVCGVIEPGAASTWPRSTSSRFVPRSSAPMLSPASPSSSSLRNISTPVTTVFVVGRRPTISISSPTFTLPRSTREHGLDWHQERLVQRPLRRRNVRVQRLHQLHDGALPNLRRVSLERL